MRTAKDVSLKDLIDDLIAMADEALLERGNERWSDAQVMLDAVLVLTHYQEIKTP